MILIDSFAAAPDISERHTLVVAAPPERVLAAARALRSREVPLLLALMGLRGLPGLLRGRVALRPNQPLLDEFVGLGFVALAHTHDELVYGVTGRFWRLDGGLRRVRAERFADFGEPGWVQAVLSFHVEPHPAGTLLSTETRVSATDARSLRRFRRYWRLIRAGSVAIRLAWLRAIRRRAQR